MITKILKCFVCGFSLTAVGALRADTITFDDTSSYSFGTGLPVYTTPGAAIPNGYQGLDWYALYAINASTAAQSGYTVGDISGNNVMMIPDSRPVAPVNPIPPSTITSASLFYLVSGFFTSAYLNGDMLEVIGKNGTALAFDEKFTLSVTNTSFLTFPALPITEVDFFTSATNFNDAPFKNGAGENVAVDNLTINFVNVPEATYTALLLAASAGGLALLRKRLA